MNLAPDFDPANLEAALGGPVALRPVASGQSNPTWFVDHAGRRLVLRKKPRGANLSSAHAVEREYRVMAALEGTGVPVPRMVMLEENSDVLGTPFYLMERLDGIVSEDSSLPQFSPKSRRAIYKDAAQVLARLHSVNWQAAGLSTFGKSTDYYARQVKRWALQWEATRTRDDRLIDELSDWFSKNVPADSTTTIVHGDYRIGNLMLDPASSRIIGVLDWELSTLGDPLSDLAHWSMFAVLRPEQLGGVAGLNLQELGIPGSRQFLDIYRAAGGVEAELTPFHRAFALYRMSVIFEGIKSRAQAGQAASAHAAEVGTLAPVCARLANDVLSGDAR